MTKTEEIKNEKNIYNNNINNFGFEHGCVLKIGRKKRP